MVGIIEKFEEIAYVEYAPRRARAKEVIVKIRCAYCKQVYDESLDRCPNCGAGH
jgi:rRNA maturation endonuclease Nob1